MSGEQELSKVKLKHDRHNRKPHRVHNHERNKIRLFKLFATSDTPSFLTHHAPLITVLITIPLSGYFSLVALG
jgi:hypothetical protein